MKISFKKEFGQLIPYSLEDKDALEKLKDGAIYEIDVKTLDTRTLKQNAAMHKYFGMLSKELNNGGLSIKKVIKVDVAWSAQSVKDLLWRPIQEALLHKKSTAKLDKDEITKVFETLNLALGQKFGVHVPFPTKELS